jgi:hypothetical protein
LDKRCHNIIAKFFNIGPIERLHRDNPISFCLSHHPSLRLWLEWGKDRDQPLLIAQGLEVVDHILKGLCRRTIKDGHNIIAIDLFTQYDNPPLPIIREEADLSIARPLGRVPMHLGLNIVRIVLAKIQHRIHNRAMAGYSVLDRLYVQILDLNRFNALSDRVRERLILLGIHAINAYKSDNPHHQGEDCQKHGCLTFIAHDSPSS